MAAARPSQDTPAATTAAADVAGAGVALWPDLRRAIAALGTGAHASVPPGIVALFGRNRERVIRTVQGWRAVDDGSVLTREGHLVLPQELKRAAVLYALLNDLARRRMTEAEAGAEGCDVGASADVGAGAGVGDAAPTSGGTHHVRRHTALAASLLGAKIHAVARSVLAVTAADVVAVLECATAPGPRGGALPPSFPATSRLLAEEAERCQHDESLRPHWAALLRCVADAEWVVLHPGPAHLRQFADGKLSVLLLPRDGVRVVLNALVVRVREQLHCRRAILTSDGCGSFSYACLRSWPEATSDSSANKRQTTGGRGVVPWGAAEQDGVATAWAEAASAAPQRSSDGGGGDVIAAAAAAASAGDADLRRREWMARAAHNAESSAELKHPRFTGCRRQLVVLYPLADGAPFAMLWSLEAKHTGHTPGDASDDALMALPHALERLIQSSSVAEDGTGVARHVALVTKVNVYGKEVCELLDKNAKRVFNNAAPVAIRDADGGAVVTSAVRGPRARGGRHVLAREHAATLRAADVRAADAAPAPLAERVCVCGMAASDAVIDDELLVCDNQPCPNGRVFHLACVGVPADTAAQVRDEGLWCCPACCASAEESGAGARRAQAEATAQAEEDASNVVDAADALAMLAAAAPSDGSTVDAYSLLTHAQIRSLRRAAQGCHSPLFDRCAALLDADIATSVARGAAVVAPAPVHEGSSLEIASAAMPGVGGTGKCGEGRRPAALAPPQAHASLMTLTTTSLPSPLLRCTPDAARPPQGQPQPARRQLRPQTCRRRLPPVPTSVAPPAREERSGASRTATR